MGHSSGSGSSPSTDTALRAFLHLVTLAESISFDLWRTHGLTLGQARLLQRIRVQPMVAGDLAKELGVRAASLTRMMERLETNGLVERSLDREDRRRVWVGTTEAGRQILGGLDFWHKGTVVRALEGMTDQEREDFRQSVECFIGHVQDQYRVEDATRSI